MVRLLGQMENRTAALGAKDMRPDHWHNGGAVRRTKLERHSKIQRWLGLPPRTGPGIQIPEWQAGQLCESQPPMKSP